MSGRESLYERLLVLMRVCGVAVVFCVACEAILFGVAIWEPDLVDTRWLLTTLLAGFVFVGAMVGLFGAAVWLHDTDGSHREPTS